MRCNIKRIFVKIFYIFEQNKPHKRGEVAKIYDRSGTDKGGF